MLVPAVAFSDFILAIHILGVIVGFGVTFTYPLLLGGARKLDPAVMPWLLRTMRSIGRRVVNPGLTVVLLAGIYLATDLHQWSSFFVGWGIVAVIVLGALEGAIMIPREGKLAELAERDLAATAVPGGGQRASAEWSPEFRSGFRVLQTVGMIESLIVVITVFLMATHAGGS